MEDQYSKELLQSIRRNDLEHVQDLLQRGVNVNGKDGSGQSPTETPLLLAIGLGSIPIIKLLLANGATLHNSKRGRYTPLAIAIRSNYPEVVDMLLELGVSVNEELDSSSHWTALHMAASGGDTRIVSALLAHGALVDGTQKKWTPLLCATSNGHADCVRLLIEHGADVNPKTRAGNTALGLAVHKKFTQAAEILRMAGAKLRHEVQ